MILLSLLACADPPETVVDSAPAPALRDARATLIRASLDLRRRRPSVEEVEAVSADPEALGPLLDAMLQDAGFAQAVIDLNAGHYRTLVDEFPVHGSELGVDDEAAFVRAVGEEPLRLLAEVALEDLPWTTIVTADWTMADEVLLGAWPMEPLAEGEGWRRARYTDGRPAAGVLSTNSLWWRYETSRTNKSRARANEVTRILLCNDFLDRTITFDRSVDLSDEEVAARALTENPGCASCHSSLDPLAGFLGGFYFPRKSGASEMTWYHPEREDIWRWQTGVAPGYFGAPGETIDDLGRYIAGDPRFVECAVRSAAEQLWGREITLEDTAALTAHREAFLTSGLTYRGLLRSLMGDPAYALLDDEDPRAVPTKLVTAALLADAVEDLTGFRLSSEGWDLMRSDTLGLRVLAGGSDGAYVTRDSDRPTATHALVVERLAQMAAHHVVAEDAANRDAPRLFTLHDPAAPLDEELAREQLRALHLRVLSVPLTPNSESEDELLALIEEVSELTSSREDGWASALSVLLRDPGFVLY
ncbi:MAG: DUF1588 domain-containing protein [Alphaproteobacteria bacterium]|nr:DUF1588 domain-containing protein [Alphaproteobacteria bacterium]MCB9795307.1 DUF1588 domain-containing protein [Alphaproteobacteria bacterium]